jgi:16S rRNA (uracil1498-N3)-methyltransferase
MNLILLEEIVDRQRFPVGDPRFDHARGVLRARSGDTFMVGVPDGPLGKATVLAVTAEALEVEVEWGERPPPPPPVTLLLGMCRPAVARRILQTLPTLGVRQVLVFAGGRSDPAYARSALWREGEWRRALLEGLEQAFDTHVPRVEVFSRLVEAIEALKASEPDALKVALDVYAESGWTALAASRPPSATLAIGSERGWTEPERTALDAAGFQRVSLLGGRVMRCETAVTVGLGLLYERCGWLEERPRWQAVG